MLGRDSLAPGKECLPAIDRPEAFIAIDLRQMLQERETQRCQPAWRGAAHLRLKLGQHFGEILLEDMALEQQHRTCRSFQHFVQLAGGEECADRRRDTAGKRRAEQTGKEFVPIGDENADSGAFAHPAGGQRTRHSHRAIQQIGIGPAHGLAVLIDYRRFARAETLGDFLDIAAQRQRTDPFLFGQRNAARYRQALNDLGDDLSRTTHLSANSSPAQ